MPTEFKCLYRTRIKLLHSTRHSRLYNHSWHLITITIKYRSWRAPYLCNSFYQLINQPFTTLIASMWYLGQSLSFFWLARELQLIPSVIDKNSTSITSYVLYACDKIDLLQRLSWYIKYCYQSKDLHAFTYIFSRNYKYMQINFSLRIRSWRFQIRGIYFSCYNQ